MAAKKFPIEAGHIMMFARAVGDPNPIYHDADAAADTEPGSVIAPPTFYQSSAQYDPDYFLRPKIGEPWFGSGKNPTGVPPKRTGGDGGTGLHAEQRFEYFRHVSPGETLTIKTRPGKTWERQGKRGGNLTFSENITEYFDESGELVVRATGVGVRTEKVVESD